MNPKLCFILFCLTSLSSFGQDPVLKPSDLNHLGNTGSLSIKPLPGYGAHLGSNYKKKFEHLVLDGFVVQNESRSSEIPDSLRFVHRQLIGDHEKLAPLGFRFKEGGVDWLESEPTDYHRFIYATYREKVVPLQLWNHNLPFVVNGQLITPAKYDTLKGLISKEIKEIYFLRWDAKEIKHFDNIAFGAVIIKTT